ncbi:MAG: VOC family protein [Solirubrobacteraceae bacterium]
MTVQRMDNVGIVVDDLPATIAFFRELGLELEGQATIEGDWAGRVTGLRDMRVEIAMMRTPDGHSRLEISRFLTPPAVAGHRNAPVNALGYLRGSGVARGCGRRRHGPGGDPGPVLRP